MMASNRRTRPRHLGIVGKPLPDIQRLRPVANVPAHLRTDFKPTDGDIRTLVQNVLAGRNRLKELREEIQKLIKKGEVSPESGTLLIAIIDREE